jgi:membrane-bound lytic murein transglycosylase B
LALCTPLVLLSGAAGGFASFVAGVRAEALREGISASVLRQALSGIVLNAKVLELDRHQPEFTLTWAQYRARVLPEARLAAGHAAYARQASLLAEVTGRYPADPRIVVGIWGLESGFGAKTGNFGVVEALATLSYDNARRAGYFRAELLKALKILDNGDITPAGMTGSWAGAMGQPQFMPSSYLAYAVDFEGNGRRDIWKSLPDVFASVANYLARSGWRAGEPWGQPIRIPPNFDAALAGRQRMRTLGEWMAHGVRRSDGTKFSRDDVPGDVLLPDGPGGDAFMVYENFNVIRRYNPSDYYALAVGLLGNACA